MVKERRFPSRVQESKIVQMYASKDLGVLVLSIITQERKTTCVSHTLGNGEMSRRRCKKKTGGPVWKVQTCCDNWIFIWPNFHFRHPTQPAFFASLCQKNHSLLGLKSSQRGNFDHPRHRGCRWPGGNLFFPKNPFESHFILCFFVLFSEMVPTTTFPP